MRKLREFLELLREIWAYYPIAIRMEYVRECDKTHMKGDESC